MQDVEVSHLPPTAEEFVRLRAVAGLPERTIASANRAIPHSLFWITLRKRHQLIGMGRVVGDGGSVVQISDVIVDPEHRQEGLLTIIFDQIQEFIFANIPSDAFVCLFATKDAVSFYEKRGFRMSQEKWPGMFWPCADRAKKE